MKILVIGGSGFVSGHAADEALRRGHEVWCLTRGNRPVRPQIHSLTADRNDVDAFATAVEGGHWDAVLDCICYTAEQARDDIRILGKVTDRLVIISTDSVYHPDHKTVPQNEDADVYLTDGLYGAKKREMELVFLNECPASLRWTIFRPGHIFGPGSELGAYPQQTRQKDLIPVLRQGTPMRLVGGGDQYLIHPVYGPDLARVMMDCLEVPACMQQIFCIGGPDVVTNRQYYEIVGELLNIPIHYETIPQEGYLAVHPQYSGYLCHRSYDLHKLQSTGIRLPDMSLREGLRLQIEWLIRERGF